MYGKTFESMYEGSMIGAGMHVFAVWNYIIAKNRSGVIEINPKLLAFRLAGEDPNAIQQVIDALEFLQKPDPESRSKVEEGRRIIKEGQYQYRLVNWKYYDSIRNELDRREYNRRKQIEYRARSRPLKGEVAAVKAAADGDIAEHDRLAADGQSSSFNPFVGTPRVNEVVVRMEESAERFPLNEGEVK